MVWISPLHTSWTTLAINEFYQNPVYEDLQRIVLMDLGLWTQDAQAGIDDVILYPEYMLLVLIATSIVFHLVSALVVSFRYN